MNNEQQKELTIKFLNYIKDHHYQAQHSILNHIFPKYEGFNVAFITIIIPDLLYKELIYELKECGITYYGITAKGREYIKVNTINNTINYTDTLLLDSMIKHRWSINNDNIPLMFYVQDTYGEMVGNNHTNPREAIIEAIKIVELGEDLKLEDFD